MILFLIFTYTIANISVDAKFTNKDLIIQTSGFKIGERFKESMISQAINNLYRLKLFDHIAIDTTIVADGIFINIRVIEAPFLSGEPQFIGNKKIKKSDLKKKVDLKEGQVLTKKTIFDSRVKIIDLYNEKNFYNTTVRDSVVPDTLNRVRLYFLINEGSPLRISKIKIEGNKMLSEGSIKRKMQNKEKGFLRSGKLDRNKLKEDIERIKIYYRENGFLDVVVQEPEIDVINDKLMITIKVKENQRYYVGNINFTGNTLFTNLQLEKMMKIKPKEVFNLTKAQNSLQRFYEAYADEGYIYCAITPVETIRDSFVDIEYQVNESRPANINRVIIAGNHRTREKVIRREITTLPGTRFRRSEVIRSMREVFNLGFFEDIKPETGTPDDSGNIDLIYRVKEKEGLGSIGAGMAYSAQDKLTGYVELSHPNIFGRGQRIYTKFEIGGRLTNVQFGFTEPWLFDTRTTAGFDLYYTNRRWDFYTKRDIGAATNFSFPFYLDYTRFNYTFRVERTQIFDIAKEYQPGSGYDLRRDTIPKWTLANNYGITRDTRDFIFNPSSGSYISFQSEIAKPWLFANIDYNRFTYETRSYFPIFWKFVLMARFRMGIATSSEEVPYYKRFYAGGTGEDGVRGYPDRSLSPMEDGKRIGGNAIFINNIELKLKFSQSFAILAFYDMGNAFTSYKDFNLYDLKRGAGIGIRVEIPMMGVLGFDLGYGFDRAQPGFEPHFQINPFGMF
ncbi:MAG: outer membrane protein assembly factor BamA [candidate division WOR-3 bacterium]|nr:outer membrane protein assembly factor BamA [candidate division WOR-3 bacterium]